jgi:hypothetical protein
MSAPDGTDDRERISPMWTVVAIFAAMSAVYFAADAHELRHRLKRGDEKLTAAVDERRACGADLDWCKTTAKGTCDYVASKLRAAEGEWDR